MIWFKTKTVTFFPPCPTVQLNCFASWIIPCHSRFMRRTFTKEFLIRREVWPYAHSSIPRLSLFLLVGYFHSRAEFLDNTYFVETPSAIPNGCPRNLGGAASDYVIGEDWVHTEAVAWWAIEKVKQRFPDVCPGLLYASWVMNSSAKRMSGTQNQREPLNLGSITGRGKTVFPIGNEAGAKQWRVMNQFDFPLKGNLVLIALESRWWKPWSRQKKRSDALSLPGLN